MITRNQILDLTFELMRQALEARRLASETPGNMGFVYCGKIDGLIDACRLLDKLIDDDIQRTRDEQLARAVQ